MRKHVHPWFDLSRWETFVCPLGIIAWLDLMKPDNIKISWVMLNSLVQTSGWPSLWVCFDRNSLFYFLLLQTTFALHRFMARTQTPCYFWVLCVCVCYIRQLFMWHNQIIPMTESSRSEGLSDSSSMHVSLSLYCFSVSICVYSVFLLLPLNYSLALLHFSFGLYLTH